MKYNQKLKEKLKEIENEKSKIMLLSEVAQQQEKKFNNDRYETGIGLFDVATTTKKKKGGLSDGDIIIISAPTGNGKTLFCSTVANNFAQQGLPVLFFSYEVGIPALWDSFAEMGADPRSLVYCPLENVSGKIDWIQGKIKEGKEKYNTKLVVIDHLGFLAPRQAIGNISQNYSAYITQIVRELKTLAIQERVIIMLPAHMNKSATDDPTLRDIGHSGGIAQEADFVVLLSRKENTGTLTTDYYSPFTKIKIAKNRLTGATRSGWLTKKNGKLIETFEPKSEDEFI